MSQPEAAQFPPARILGVETSCDETAAAVIEDGRTVLSSLVASQAELHARYGGVFPEVASRQHVRTIYPVVQETLKRAHLEMADIDSIAVTRGPGLPGSLVVGINTAKGIALASGKPLIGINHLEAHIYSAWLDWSPGKTSPAPALKPEPRFPLVVLIASGGHSELILMKGHLQYERLGGTLDDAAGESFDKVARMLELGYPGGPAIQTAAEAGNPERFQFPRAWLEEPSARTATGKGLKPSWNFSFSGLKTAVLRQVKVFQEAGGLNKLPVEDLAASFQAAVVDVLVGKTIQAAREFKAAEILVAGGVSANKMLREAFLSQDEFSVQIPPLALCTDNAAMVAAAGYYRFVHGHRDSLDMDVRPTWPLSEL
jgi:N6-L-threonylcarbamoyladenine synthase